MGYINNMSSETKKESTMKTVKNEMEWASGNNTIKVVSTLTLSETINLDGHETEVDCCHMDTELTVNGNNMGSGEMNPRTNMFSARLGKVQFSKQNDIDNVKSVIAATESHPAWIKKMEAEQRALESLSADTMPCECGTYCYGDCSAN